MQLHFSTDEFQVLADAMLHRDRELREQIVHADQREFQRKLQQQQQTLDELEDRILRKDLELGTDELDFLLEVIEHCERELIAEIARTDAREFRNALQRKADALARIHDKVAEACAMV